MWRRCTVVIAASFFQSHEPAMYDYMIRHEHLLTNDNKEGLDKVLDKDQNYAFLMESSTILYHTERICNLTQIGDLIDDKNYAIGMRKSNSNYYDLNILYAGNNREKSILQIMNITVNWARLFYIYKNKAF